MSGFEDGRRWRVSLFGQAPDELPDQWVAGLAAVTQDLGCRRHGRAVSFEGVAWELVASSEGWVRIGIVNLTGDADLSEFSVCQSYTLDTTSAQATVWAASAMQDELAGYEFVQWPSDGWRLLTPVLMDGDALWLNPSTDKVVSRIGSLCEAADSQAPFS